MAPTITLPELTGLGSEEFYSRAALARRGDKYSITVDVDVNMHTSQGRRRLNYLMDHDPSLVRKFTTQNYPIDLGLGTNNLAEIIISTLNAALQAPDDPTAEDFNDPMASLWWPHLHLTVRPNGDDSDQACISVTNDAGAQLITALYLWHNNEIDIPYNLLAEKLEHPYLAAAIIAEAYAGSADLLHDDMATITAEHIAATYHHWNRVSAKEPYSVNPNLLDGLALLRSIGSSMMMTVTIPTAIITSGRFAVFASGD